MFSQAMREGITPERRQDLEPEEVSYSSKPDYRPFRKCLAFNSEEGCAEAFTGGYCGNPRRPLLHVCDR